MGKTRSSRPLSAADLRQLVAEQRMAQREARLEHFRKTGRIDPAAAELATNLENSLPTTTARRSIRFLDVLLLLVECGAVLGLIYVVLSGLNILQNLNQQVLTVIQQPTLTSTPLISAVVLPSGHLPPDESGAVLPNEAEIPQHLRPVVQSLASAPLPTPAAEQAIRIQIPILSVDAPVIQGDNWEQLKKGVGQHLGSANPGQAGNVVLSAHNDVFGEIFRDLVNLQPGDEVTLFTSQRTYTYIVNSVRIVEPNAVEVMLPTLNPTLTLISCYPYRVDDKRIAITASLQNEK